MIRSVGNATPLDAAAARSKINVSKRVRSARAGGWENATRSFGCGVCGSVGVSALRTRRT